MREKGLARSLTRVRGDGALHPFRVRRMKPLTINGIIQTACVLLGFFALRLLCRPSMIDAHPAGMHFHPFSVLLTRYGLFLLLFPLGWIVYATMASSQERGLFSSRAAHTVGILFSAVTVIAFLYAAVLAFRSFISQ